MEKEHEFNKISNMIKFNIITIMLFIIYNVICAFDKNAFNYYAFVILSFIILVMHKIIKEKIEKYNH